MADLLAFAQGAEAAQQQNWRDALNTMRMDLDAERLRQSQAMFPTELGMAQERLRQSQTAFDIGLPVAKIGAEAQVGNIQEQLNALAGNRRASEFQLGLSTELQNIPREQQAEIIAQRSIDRLRALGTGPGAAQEAQALNRYLGKVASDYVAAGDVAGAQRILSAIPGADAGSRIAELQKWSDPRTAFDPANIQAAGGTVLPDGNIQMGQFKISPVQFAMMQRARAGDPMANVLPGLQQIQQQQQLSPILSELQRRYAELGYQTVLDPANNRLIPLPQAMPGFGPTAPQPFVGPPQPFIPGPMTSATPPFMPPEPGTTAPAMPGPAMPGAVAPAMPGPAMPGVASRAASTLAPTGSSPVSDADLLAEMRSGKPLVGLETRILGPRPGNIRGQQQSQAQRDYDAALTTLRNQINGLMRDPTRQNAANNVLNAEGRNPMMGR